MADFYASKTDDIEKRELFHEKTARELAGECMVLLQNDGTLPLRNLRKVALFGNGARATVKGGTGSGDVNTRKNVSVEQGLYGAGVHLTTEAWLNRQEEAVRRKKEEHLAWTLAESERTGSPAFIVQFEHPFSAGAPEKITEEDCQAADCDTAVYVLSRNSGECADRKNEPGDYRLFAEEKENIACIAKHFAKTVVLLNIGGLIDLKEICEIPGVNSILLMTQLGNIGGDAVADVLLGKVTPSGKTTDTWAEKYLDYPSSAEFSHNGDVLEQFYREGIYVGYRYFDSFGVKVRVPFGFGLSYTTFAVCPNTLKVFGTEASVEVCVKNTGTKFAGKEVVQLYISAPQGRLAKPYQELKAYRKTRLLTPGEEEKVTLTFCLTSLASYSEEAAAWILEKGDYLVRIGNSSQNTKTAGVIRVPDTVICEQLQNFFPLDASLQEINAKKQNEETQAEDGVVVELSPRAIATKTAVYQTERKPFAASKQKFLTAADIRAGKATVEELTAQLTVEEMAELCVGTSRVGGSVIATASKQVPGAAGDTAAVLEKDRGIRGAILADGPAGLRLQAHFKAATDGTILPGGEGMGDDIAPFDPELTKDGTDYYQYCTAIPIGWALAQSWNTDLVERAGDMVGSEMEQFGVDIWLAPAMNIHRNPLCGRNFEYYSEDPYISGTMAAAITRGVQKHKGKGTCIKHFAANNQEENRYFVNEHISERALREIYLKGFEIAVRTTQPLSVMTSYNLINGLHASNRRDLIQHVLRDEWGFEGVVMTDWYTSQDVPEITGKYHSPYPISASTGCIYAGNDVQMPGCEQNLEDIIAAVKSGKEKDGYKITLADLQQCTANVIRLALKVL